MRDLPHRILHRRRLLYLSKGHLTFCLYKTSELLQRRVLADVRSKVDIHGLPIVGVVVDRVCDRCDDIKIETCSSCSPSKLRMTSSRYFYQIADPNHYSDRLQGVDLKTMQPSIRPDTPPQCSSNHVDTGARANLYNKHQSRSGAVVC